MENLARDIRYSLRKLLRTPGFTIVAVATLALAIGATTAVFSIVNGVLLAPLPFPEFDRLVRVGTTSDHGPLGTLSYPDFTDYRDRSRTVAAMAAIDRETRNLVVPDREPRRLATAEVSANFFTVLGVPAALGRTFTAGDDAAGAPRIAIVSTALWRQAFGGDARVVGRTISIDGQPTTIVGVAPAAADYPAGIDLWIPFVAHGQAFASSRDAHFLQAIGRLAPGATVAAASAEMARIGDALSREYPATNARSGGTVVSLRDSLVGNVRPALLVMFGAVAFVLLVACANIANLLLVRAAGREVEIAVRTALGAGTAHVTRQLVCESLLLTASGAALGAVLAGWAVDAVRRLGPASVPRLASASVDTRALAFAALVAVATGILFGVIPALHARRSRVGHLLRSGTRGSSGTRGADRTRAALVVGEIALTCVLLVGAGLLTRSFVRLVRVDPGYRADHLVTMSVSLPTAAYPWDAQAIAFAHDVLARMRRVPGETDAALAFGRPLSTDAMQIRFGRDDRPPLPPAQRTSATLDVVSPSYFATFGIPVVQGRPLTTADRDHAPTVAVISRRFAQEFYAGETPIGKTITLAWSRQRSADPADTVGGQVRIVGVVGDVKSRGNALAAPPAVYVPFDQAPIGELSLIVRSAAPPGAVIAAAEREIAAVDPTLPVYDVRTMADAVRQSLAQPRFYAAILDAFAGIALVIAALGIYGVIAYAVSQRTRELGIRLALGAPAQRVVRLVVGRGVVLAVAGVAIGFAAAYWLTRLLAGLLFGVAAADPLTFAGVGAALLGVAVVASLVPARRAARVDPLIAMRSE